MSSRAERERFKLELERTKGAFSALLAKHDIRSADHPSAPYDLSWGFVGEGWLGLLDDLFTRLVALGWDRQVGQIKQKFGGLCIYLGERTPEMDQLVWQANQLSFFVCEKCGSLGALRRFPGAGAKTLCDEHADGAAPTRRSPPGHA